MSDLSLQTQGDIVFAHELARLYGEQGIVSTACNPGNLRSPLQRHLNIFEDSMIVCLQFAYFDCQLNYAIL